MHFKACCRLLTDVPRKLYRIDYPGSRTTYVPDIGFEATDTTTTFESGNRHCFKRAIEKQFRWSCRDPVPLISLFSDREHAENWDRQEPWHRNPGQEGGWALYVINGTILKQTTSIFKLSTVMKRLKPGIPEGASQHIEGAYLCLHLIPPDAIVEKRTPAQVEDDHEDRYLSRIDEQDRYDYLGECGDGDSDREMLQENYNSIYERNY